jgi:hypothetical protein
MPASASAEETTCRGSLGAVTVDNLRVPQEGRCILTGTRGSSLRRRQPT